MNKKLFVFFAVTTLMLMGCNKEENVSIPASTDQQQQAVLTTSTNDNSSAVPATTTTTTTTPVAVPIQDSGNLAGQQVIPQAPQNAAVVAPQTVPSIDSQNQIQPTPVVPISSQQNELALPATQAPVAEGPIVPADTNAVTPPVAPSSVVPVAPSTSEFPAANEPTSAQSAVPYGAPAKSVDSLSTTVPATIPGSASSMDTSVSQANNPVITKVSYRKRVIDKDKDDEQKGDNSSPTDSTNDTKPTSTVDED